MRKTVVITGASRGLGKALSIAFAPKWQVIATARNPERIAKSENIMPMSLDVADEISVQEFSHELAAKQIKVDLLINNAGFNPKDSEDPEYFQSTFTIKKFLAKNVAESLWINALMPMQLVSQMLPVLTDDAVVLNISSWLGSISSKTGSGHYGYAGSKALLNMFTKGLALEWQDSARSAVAINPGWMRTDMGGPNAKITTEEVAKAILKLYEDGTLQQHNGQFLNTDGSVHPW